MLLGSCKSECLGLSVLALAPGVRSARGEVKEDRDLVGSLGLVVMCIAIGKLVECG